MQATTFAVGGPPLPPSVTPPHHSHKSLAPLPDLLLLTRERMHNARTQQFLSTQSRVFLKPCKNNPALGNKMSWTPTYMFNGINKLVIGTDLCGIESKLIRSQTYTVITNDKSNRRVWSKSLLFWLTRFPIDKAENVCSVFTGWGHIL